jgi:hypothetical protein
MIEREAGQMQLVCDATSVRHPRSYDHDDFEVMIEDAKSDGWIVKIEKGDWKHYSPESRSAKVEFASFEGIE